MHSPFRLVSRLAAALAVPIAMLAAAPAASLTQETLATMQKATAFMRSIATEGGYLWRYSPDLSERAGENPATPTQIWVQPPGTPSMGMAFLRAYQATGDATYLKAAKAAADALAVGQAASGGWDHFIEFDPEHSKGWYRRSDLGRISTAEAATRRNLTSFDDDNTQSALRLLIAVADASKGADEPHDRRIREARDYGLKKLLEAQRPNGGWPQRWTGIPVDPAEYPVHPARYPEEYPRKYPMDKFHGHYTLNDNTQRDCIMTLLEAGKRLGRPEYRAAALKGGDFLIRAQMPEPQPVWAQQYNSQLEPTWARSFEPPSVCSSESVGVMRLLVDLYLETGDTKYLEPLPRAIAWFRRSGMEPGIWARMYELRTNTPIFGNRDGEIKYRREEAKTGYSWRGPYGVAGAISYYEEAKRDGQTTIMDKRRKAETEAATAAGKAARRRSLEPGVRAAIAALDADGRWVTDDRGAPMINTSTFITLMRTLSEYIEVTKQ